jgi:membrane protein implicated in regulation of membrane protease activity
MLTPTPFFYLALASAVFLIASRAVGGRHAHGRGRKGRGARLWSLGTAVTFLAGFGVGGFFAATADLGDALTLGVGAASGLALAAVEVGLLGALAAREGSSAHRVDEFVGAVGTVEISIAADGVGRVRCRRGAVSEALLARSSGLPIPAGAVVRVLSVAGTTVVVAPVDPNEVHGPSAWRE